jgi:hypothetical protein
VRRCHANGLQSCLIVIAGLDPAIHGPHHRSVAGVDARIKSGHDGGGRQQCVD